MYNDSNDIWKCFSLERKGFIVQINFTSALGRGQNFGFGQKNISKKPVKRVAEVGVVDFFTQVTDEGLPRNGILPQNRALDSIGWFARVPV